MTPGQAVDGYAPPWGSFASFFASRQDVGATYLVERHHERGTRREWTVQQWRDRVAAVGAWLVTQGVGPGEAVATLAGNTADALALANACWLVGACCVPLNPGDSIERQAFILRDASVLLLVAAQETQPAAEALGLATGVPTRMTSELQDLPLGVAVEDADGVHAAALRIYTSGTTGEPKAVVLTLANLLTDCDALRAVLGWDASTHVLTVLPIHHVNGMVVSSLLPWFAGASTVLCDRFRSDSFWQDAAGERATVCSVVPSLLEFLLGAPGSAPVGFREVLCGAGPLLVETALDFEQRFRVPVRHLYGLSETTAVATVMPGLEDGVRRAWHRDYGFPSIGTALPHVQVGVLDRQDQPAGHGVRGELVVRGAVVMQGYADRSDDTAEAFRGGWFHTGDEGFWQPDQDGRPFFFITGRMKELIIRGGSNISPFEVDAVLRSHPAVRFGLAVPFENRFYGEEIAAYVVRDAAVSAEDILAHSARYLDHARCPKVVVFGDDVPFTATGKAKRLELKERLAPLLAQYRQTQFRRPRSGDA